MTYLDSMPCSAGFRVGTTKQKVGFIAPMLCKRVQQLPEPSGWFYEVKHEGYRVIAVKDYASVELFSCSGTPVAYPEARNAVRQLRAGRAVIDCELIAFDREGRPSFETLASADEASAIRLYASDLLHLNGRDLTEQPIERRKEKLCTIAFNSPLLFSPALNCEPEMLVEEVRRLSIGGVIAKRKGSIYQSGKTTGAWLTVPTRREPSRIDFLLPIGSMDGHFDEPLERNSHAGQYPGKAAA